MAVQTSALNAQRHVNSNSASNSNTNSDVGIMLQDCSESLNRVLVIKYYSAYNWSLRRFDNRAVCVCEL